MNWFKLGISLFWAIVGLACLTFFLLAIKWALSLFSAIGIGLFLALIIVGLLTLLIYNDIND
jgi:hypothetical protein